MAWLEKRGNQFHLCIRIGGRKLKRSLQTKKAYEAQQIAARVERRMTLIEQGDLSMPDGADPLTFLLSDGKLTKSVTISATTTLGYLCDQYLNDLPKGSMEANTNYTLKIHLAHLRRVLGDEFNVGQLEFADLQRYVDKRSVEAGRRGKTVSTVTIKKELTSFSSVWSWGIRMKLVKGAFPNKGLRYSKTQEKKPFQTWAEIERQIGFGGLTEHEEAELWEGLYLTAAELEQVLDFVRGNASHPAVYLIFVIAAHQVHVEAKSFGPSERTSTRMLER